jgi:hypothetical protein
MGKDGRIHREFRDTLWEEHQPVSFLRAWEESQRRLSLLESTPFSWVIKVFPEHFHCLDLHRFQQLLQRNNTKVIILYRNFMWDWLLSWTALRQTGVFQETKIDSDWKKPDITAKNLSLDFIETWYGFAHEFVNMCYSYRRSADHVVAYENFTGNPQRDAYRITGIDLFPEVVHQVKLWSTKEKESMISNIGEVKARFLIYCRLLGFPNGKLVI